MPNCAIIHPLHLEIETAVYKWALQSTGEVAPFV